MRNVIRKPDGTGSVSNLLSAHHFQIAYVTNDLDHACDILNARYGVREFAPLDVTLKAGGQSFPLMFRMSQWKLQDYAAKVCTNPQELEQLVLPLLDAGVDIFDCSQRRFWEPEFEGSDLNLAGWVRKITGKPTMTVGSVGLDIDLTLSLKGKRSKPVSIQGVMEKLQNGECDLVGVGRALLGDPEWPKRIRDGEAVKPFEPECLTTLW